MSIIFTEKGWRALGFKRNDIGQPARTAPLKADGRYVLDINPMDYDSQGRFIGDNPQRGLETLIRAVGEENRTMREQRIYRHGGDIFNIATETRARRDKWGVKILT